MIRATIVKLRNNKARNLTIAAQLDETACWIRVPAERDRVQTGGREERTNEPVPAHGVR